MSTKTNISSNAKITNLLTNNSRKKYDNFLMKYQKNYALDNFLIKFEEAYLQEIVLEKTKNNSISLMQNRFISFDKKFNQTSESKFIDDVKNMKETFSVQLMIGQEKIFLNFLSKNIKKDNAYIAVIIHAINTFCHLFPYNYHQLRIDICLDDNIRILDYPSEMTDFDDIFDYLQKNSLGFNVSGLTQRFKKEIIMVRKEEIIKLIFHELVHYIGLDQRLLGVETDYHWPVISDQINLYEAYTETVSVILTTAYNALQIVSVCGGNQKEIFNQLLNYEYNYSLSLTAQILKFYHYHQGTFRQFFIDSEKKLYNPIYVWEYIILRSNLLCHLDDLLTGLQDDFRIDDTSFDKIIHLFEIDEEFMDQLEEFMMVDHGESVSYLLVDLDWRKI